MLSKTLGFIIKIRYWFLLLLITCGEPAFADIYKYRDSSGRLFFTDIPKSAKYEKVILKGWMNPSQNYNTRLLKQRMKPYEAAVAAAAYKFSLPKPLLHAVIATESAYNPKALSSAGAMGLMQLMPATAKRFGVSDAFNPEENIRGGSEYLQYLMTLFKGDLALVLAAYNAGEGAVMKYGNSIPPYKETQNYVKKVKSLQRAFR